MKANNKKYRSKKYRAVFFYYFTIIVFTLLESLKIILFPDFLNEYTFT